MYTWTIWLAKTEKTKRRIEVIRKEKRWRREEERERELRKK